MPSPLSSSKQSFGEEHNCEELGNGDYCLDGDLYTACEAANCYGAPCIPVMPAERCKCPKHEDDKEKCIVQDQA